MKVVMAPDSYKGSITATKVCSAMERAIKEVIPTAQTIMKPMADGGEGTLEAIYSSKNTEKVNFMCRNAKGDSITTNYLVIDKDTVVIEYAMIAGLDQLNETKSPQNYTSYGLGEAILDAVDRGYNNLFIALGGSATNDAGLGMLSALGASFFDEENNKLGIYARNIHDVSKVRLTSLDNRLHETKIKVIADVTNPLCGKNGASYVYGPQKGLTIKQIQLFDESFARFGKLTAIELQEDYSTIEGAGAAGGLGFALMLLGAKVHPGAQTIGEIIQLEEALNDADIVITGEGKSDYQTLFGKAPAHVAELGLKHEVPTVLLSGAVEDREALSEVFTSCFSITPGPITLKKSIQQSEALIYEQTKQIMRLFKTQ